MGRWNPWRALRAREEARLRFRSIHPSAGGALVEVRDGIETIYLDHRLDQRERNAALADELIHLERGVPEVRCPDLLRAKEEALVRAETVRRLVPVDELAGWVKARAEVGPVTVDMVAEEWGVPGYVAETALTRLAG